MLARHHVHALVLAAVLLMRSTVSFLLGPGFRKVGCRVYISDAPQHRQDGTAQRARSESFHGSPSSEGARNTNATAAGSSSLPRKSGTSSRYRGVYLHKPTRKWCAQINAGGKRMHLGLFESEEEAARAYDAAASVHHPNPILNFPDLPASRSPPSQSELHWNFMKILASARRRVRQDTSEVMPPIAAVPNSNSNGSAEQIVNQEFDWSWWRTTDDEEAAQLEQTHIETDMTLIGERDGVDLAAGQLSDVPVQQAEKEVNTDRVNGQRESSVLFGSSSHSALKVPVVMARVLKTAQVLINKHKEE